MFLITDFICKYLLTTKETKEKTLFYDFVVSYQICNFFYKCLQCMAFEWNC